MRDVILSHYTVRNIEPAPWRETWNNLTAFTERMAPKLEPTGIKLSLRRAVLEDATQDNLMMGNMVTIEAPALEVAETPIENLLMLGLDYSECADCKTEDGAGFPCRTFLDFDGVARQALPEEFFMEATLRVAFKAESGSGCSCSGCSSCAGCGDGHEHHECE